MRTAEPCKKTTSLTTRYEAYQLEVVPFRIVIVPFTFRRIQDVVIQGPPFVKVCINDVNLLSMSKEQHVSQSREVFQRSIDRGLKTKLSECDFVYSKISLLGHVTTSDDTPVEDCRTPTFKKSLILTASTELHYFFD